MAGRPVPPVTLTFAPDAELCLARTASAYSLVICLFRALGEEGRFEPETERIRHWQHLRSELSSTHHRMVAVSSEPLLRQALPSGLLTDWLILSDSDLELTRWLPLPVTTHGSHSAYQPATLITDRSRIVKHFSSVDADDAEKVTDWLRRRASISLVPAPHGSRARPL
ncbi:MAG TPA: hypothetical protein VN618_12275 [Solirubrobacteraceae bacterium]|nr:hypothetical protein [Solirubrobacteraceae bacterium]